MGMGNNIKLKGTLHTPVVRLIGDKKEVAVHGVREPLLVELRVDHGRGLRGATKHSARLY